MEKSIRGEPKVATRLHPIFPNGWWQLHSPNTDLAHAEKENGNMVRGLGVVVTGWRWCPWGDGRMEVVVGGCYGQF